MPLRLTPLYEESSSRSMTAAFLGLNKNLRSNDGEFFDMKNLTSDNAPVLSVRERRYVPKSWQAKNPTDVIAGVGSVANGITGGVCWIDGTELRLGSQTVDLTGLGFNADEPGRSIVKLGAYLIIVPDMIYVNATKPSEDKGRIEDSYTDKESKFSLAVCDYEGEPATFAQITEPQGATNGDTWHQTGDFPKLYRYDEDKGEWYEIQSYLRITAAKYVTSIPAWQGTSFQLKSTIKSGDSIRISGINRSVDGVKMVTKASVTTFDENSVWEIFVPGIINDALVETTATASSPVTIERVIPRMDYVCEAGNRLWGCRYGDDGRGNFVNEIYCSARGDFYRWIAGAADNDDSPVTFSVGVDGEWTGAVNYQGYPTFFKETSMHRVSGYGASGFALYDAPCDGVQKGAQRSLAVVNNVLYYKAVPCVMGYDGATPVKVSDKLGRLSRYNNAVGGACGGKYYLSMWTTDPNGAVKDPVLVALDTEKGLWHKEDETECESMASDRDILYFVEVSRKAGVVSRAIKAVHVPEYVGMLKPAESDKERAAIPWYAETGIIGLEDPDAKYVSRLAVRMHLDAGASVRVLVQYDSCGIWKQIAATEAAAMKTVTMPLVPARCDHMRLRLEGVGGCKVYSITKTVESGEEV